MGREMTRIQFYLESDLSKKLEALALQHKMSKSELIRQSIHKLIQEEKVDEEEPLLKIIGLGKSNATDISVEHNAYLAGEK